MAEASTFGYSRDSSWSDYGRRMLEKSKGYLYGFTEGALRLAQQKNGFMLPASVNGAAVQYLVDLLYSKLIKTDLKGNYHPDPEHPEHLSFMNPLMTKEVFISGFKDDFVNNNRFYVEFIRLNPVDETPTVYSFKTMKDVPLQPTDKDVLSKHNVTITTQPKILNATPGVNAGAFMDAKKNYQVLLNYMVDSVQFPNYTSKKTTISRFGQDFTYVNNSQYEPNLTINFTYDMRGNIDRFLHYMSQYSKYYNNTRRNKFMIRVTSYKSIHKSTGEVTPPFGSKHVTSSYNEFKINTKLFKNAQLDSMQNYSLDNKQSDFLSRAVTFTFQGLQEESYDNLGLGSNLNTTATLTYDMYTTAYKWLQENIKKDVPPQSELLM